MALAKADVRLTGGHDLGSVWFETHAGLNHAVGNVDSACTRRNRRYARLGTFGGVQLTRTENPFWGTSMGAAKVMLQTAQRTYLDLRRRLIVTFRALLLAQR
jgi:hypothetical protein